MKTTHFPRVSSQRGFSLIEIMIGLVIGLLVSLVVGQVMSTFESNKRITTGAADTQTNGAIALFNIERELQMAGYPLNASTTSPLKCTTLTFDGVLDNTTAKLITPVIVTDGGAGVSDSITIRYGDTLDGGVPVKINALVGNDVTLQSNFGCKKDDRTLITANTVCAVSKIDQNVVAPAVIGTGTVHLQDVTLANPAASGSDVNLACLGNWNTITFSVNNGTLFRNGQPTVSGVVNLQAQYGIAATVNSNTIVAWVEPNGPTWADNVLTVANRNLIKAIRVAVVARSPKKEATNVTAACNSLTAANPTGLCAWDGSQFAAPSINMNGADAEWLRYRYRVFETTIPFRNLIWSNGTF